MRSLFRSRRELALENLALRQQVAVLIRTPGPPPTPRGMGPSFLGDPLAGVGELEGCPGDRRARDRYPWHREGFTRFWRRKSRRGRLGRPGQDALVAGVGSRGANHRQRAPLQPRDELKIRQPFDHLLSGQRGSEGGYDLGTGETGTRRWGGVSVDTLASLVPDVDVLLAMEPEEIAPYLLRLAAEFQRTGNGSFNPDNMIEVTVGTTTAPAYGGRRATEVERAVAEAWQWLRIHLLVAPVNGYNGRNGCLVISRRGEKLLRHDPNLGRFRQAAAFPKS